MGVCPRARPSSRGRRAWEPVREHAVELYDTDEFLAATVGAFVGRSLIEDDATIVVATEAHRRAFETTLESSAVDVVAAVSASRYLSFDAGGFLGLFMVKGMPDAKRFRAAVGPVIDWATAGGRQVRIYGEMVAVLWEAGQVAAAVALEDQWNDLAATRRFSLLCAYPRRLFRDESCRRAFVHMCGQHTSVVPEVAGLEPGRIKAAVGRPGRR